MSAERKTLSVDKATHQRLRALATEFDVSIKETMARIVAVIHNLPDNQRAVIKKMRNQAGG